MLKLLITLSFLMTSISSYAQIFIEPQIGYAVGSYTPESNDPSVIDLQTTISGLSYGAKLGFEFEPVQIGLDYTSTSYSYTQGSDTAKELGAMLGLRWGWFRIFGEYLFNGDFGGSDLDTGTKFGATFYALSWLAFTVDYRQVTLKDGNNDGFKDEDKYNSLGFMLSFPITF